MASMGTPLSTKAWASITFGLGSLLIFIEVFIRGPLGGGDDLGLFPQLGWSIFGVSGVLLWIGGLALLLIVRFRSRERRRGRPSSVFLRGREDYRCPRCRRTIDTSQVGYHERIKCKCGTTYDFFQDMPWDEEDA